MKMGSLMQSAMHIKGPAAHNDSQHGQEKQRMCHFVAQVSN